MKDAITCVLTYPRPKRTSFPSGLIEAFDDSKENIYVTFISEILDCVTSGLRLLLCLYLTFNAVSSLASVGRQ